MMIMRYYFFLLLAVVGSIGLFPFAAKAQEQKKEADMSPAANFVGMPAISESIPDERAFRGAFPTEPHIGRMNIREVFELRQRTFSVQRFESLAGLPPFILDNSGSTALFRYERGGEVLVLKPVHTTRGDVVYKNDRGMVVLKTRRVGSATVFMQSRSRGIVAWSTGRGSNIGPSTVSLQQMKNVLQKIAGDIAEKLDQDITISVKGANEENAWVFLDTANNVRIGIYRHLRASRKRQALQGLARIEIFSSDKLAGTIDGGVLKLAIIPNKGYLGRLSSFQIQSSLFGNQSIIDGLPVAADQYDLADEIELPLLAISAEELEPATQITEP